MNERNFRMAVIGAGNMGEALLGGVLRAGITTKEQVTVSDVDVERLDKVVREFQVQASATGTEATADADVILLSVKPQNLPAIEEELGGDAVYAADRAFSVKAP